MRWACEAKKELSRILWDSTTTLSKLELSRSHLSANCPSLSTFFLINSWQMLSCEEVSEEEECCNHQAVLSLAEGDAEVEEEGEQMLIGVRELTESVRLLRLRLNLIFTDALWDMSGVIVHTWLRGGFHCPAQVAVALYQESSQRGSSVLSSSQLPPPLLLQEINIFSTLTSTYEYQEFCSYQSETW